MILFFFFPQKTSLHLTFFFTSHTPTNFIVVIIIIFEIMVGSFELVTVFKVLGGFGFRSLSLCVCVSDKLGFMMGSWSSLWRQTDETLDIGSHVRCSAKKLLFEATTRTNRPQASVKVTLPPLLFLSVYLALAPEKWRRVGVIQQVT